jgi:hypothetical protein
VRGASAGQQPNGRPVAWFHAGNFHFRRASASPNTAVGAARFDDLAGGFLFALIAQSRSAFNLEVKQRNIILRRASIFAFLQSQGHSRRIAISR